MPRRKQPPPDTPKPVIELLNLTYEPGPDLLPRLQNCAELIKLLPKRTFTGLLPKQQASALYLSMHEVVKRAYDKFCEGVKDRLAHETMAAAADIGLVTEAPEAYKVMHPRERAVRKISKEPRLELAGTWYDPPMTGRNFSNHELECLPQFWHDLVEVLADEQKMQAILTQVMASSSQAKVKARRASSTTNRFYVDRPQLHDAYQQANSQLIIFYGMAGMGKTWLAKELVRLADGSPAPAIEVVQGKPHLPDIQKAISRFKIDTSQAVSPDLRSFITLLLTDENAPDHVLFDGFESADELKHLLPTDQTKSTVVATCRTKGEYPLEQCTFIRVDKLNQDEGAELIKRHVPRLTAEEAAKFAQRAGEYPLLLRYVSVLLVEPACPVDDFCEEVLIDSGAIAANIPTGDGRKLRNVLNELVDNIWEKSRDAYYVLLAAIFPIERFQQGVYRPDLERFLAICHGGRKSPLRTAAAIQVLLDMAILDFVSDEYFTMHALTRQILRELVRDEVLATGLIKLLISEEYRGHKIAVPLELSNGKELMLGDEWKQLDSWPMIEKALMTVGYRPGDELLPGIGITFIPALRSHL